MNGKIKVFIKGGGDLASGVAYRLYRAGFTVALSELPEPTMVRRTVSFGEAVYEGSITVENITAETAVDFSRFRKIIAAGKIPVITAGSYRRIINKYNPGIIIDGRMMKRAPDTDRVEAEIVIGLGPGFRAQENADAVIETARGHYLGRVIYRGEPIPNTGIPGEIQGYSEERVLHAPVDGIFRTERTIGEQIKKGDEFGAVAGNSIKAKIAGVIRGQIHPGLMVKRGMKIGDIDPRGVRDHCFKISDKALAIGGGVLEAILHFLKERG